MIGSGNRYATLLLGLLVLNPPIVNGQGRAARARAELDHLILGINSLEQGMKAFAALTGVVPIRGGVHPGAGTENALVSLGGGAYLELIAPRPGATPSSFAIISTLERLTPIGWALHTDSLSALVTDLRKTDSVLGPFPGSRQTPDGKLLSWKTAHMATPGLEGAPFLIEWGPGSLHPSSTSPSGCRLVTLAVTEPAPTRLNAFFHAVGLDLVAQAAPRRGLAFSLRCPSGEITFSGGL
jgi:glyoxalase-like protein